MRYGEGKLGKGLILDGSSHTVKIPHYAGLKPGKANKIGIYTYSPALDKFRNGPSSRFDLDYPMTLLPKARAANALDKK